MGSQGGRRKKEQKIHRRMVTQHHAKTRDRPVLRAGARGTTVENDLGVGRLPAADLLASKQASKRLADRLGMDF